MSVSYTHLDVYKRQVVTHLGSSSLFCGAFLSCSVLRNIVFKRENNGVYQPYQKNVAFTNNRREDYIKLNILTVVAGILIALVGGVGVIMNLWCILKELYSK